MIVTQFDRKEYPAISTNFNDFVEIKCNLTLSKGKKDRVSQGYYVEGGNHFVFENDHILYVFDNKNGNCQFMLGFDVHGDISQLFVPRKRLESIYDHECIIQHAFGQLSAIYGIDISA